MLSSSLVLSSSLMHRIARTLLVVVDVVVVVLLLPSTPPHPPSHPPSSPGPPLPTRPNNLRDSKKRKTHEHMTNNDTPQINVDEHKHKTVRTK